MCEFRGNSASDKLVGLEKENGVTCRFAILYLLEDVKTAARNDGPTLIVSLE